MYFFVFKNFIISFFKLYGVYKNVFIYLLFKIKLSGYFVIIFLLFIDILCLFILFIFILKEFKYL